MTTDSGISHTPNPAGALPAPELSPADQQQIELMAIARALNFLDEVDGEPRQPRRARRLLIGLVNVMTKRGGPLIWQWGSCFPTHPYPGGAPFTEEYSDWGWGRESFEMHGSPDIHWRLVYRSPAGCTPLTRWRPRRWTWAEPPARPDGGRL